MRVYLLTFTMCVLLALSLQVGVCLTWCPVIRPDSNRRSICMRFPVAEQPWNNTAIQTKVCLCIYTHAQPFCHWHWAFNNECSIGYQWRGVFQQINGVNAMVADALILLSPDHRHELHPHNHLFSFHILHPGDAGVRLGAGHPSLSGVMSTFRLHDWC